MEVAVGRVGGIVEILLDKGFVHLDALGVKVDGDRLIGPVDIVLGPVMRETHRRTGGCRPKFNLGWQRRLSGRQFDGIADLIGELVITGLDEACQRPTR